MHALYRCDIKYLAFCHYLGVTLSYIGLCSIYSISTFRYTASSKAFLLSKYHQNVCFPTKQSLLITRCLIRLKDNNKNNNSPLFILGYTISIASLHHGQVPYTTIPESLLQSWIKSKCTPNQPLFVSP